MASHGLRDVFNLPAEQAVAPRTTKKQRITAPRPNLKGLAREVQNLGGDNPIAIVPDVSVFKKRRLATRKPAARWELRPFKNSARDDDGTLVLRHWRRKAEECEFPPQPDGGQDSDLPAPKDGQGISAGEGTPEDSAFAKFNVRVVVPQYNDDQYGSNLNNADWTKEETDYLLGLVRDFDLRWPIIWDRYEYTPEASPDERARVSSDTAMIPAPKPRSLEDLKARYYEVAAKMMAVQKPAQYMTRPEFELYEMMSSFSPAQEKTRKDFAVNTMGRSKDEAREEESLLLEIKRILARTERFNEERRELYNRLDYPHTDQDINVYKSSSGLQNLLQNLMNIDKSKKRRSIAGGTEAAGLASAGANGQPVSAPSEKEARRESIAALGSSQRDAHRTAPATPVEPAAASAAAASGSNKKKGSAIQVERRKLSEQEEQVYGVSFHERLSSGPTFRYEKINKLYSHKSGQQQLRITNLLGELDIPGRLIMPTAAVTAQFEVLWSAVTTLVDLRKVSDKLDAEIKLEEAKRAEREKAKAALNEKSNNEEASGSEEGKPAGDGKDAQSSENLAESSHKKATAACPTHERRNNGGAGSAEQLDATEASAEPTGDGDSDPVGVTSPIQVKSEASDAALRKDKEKGPHLESGGTHKRSASVLSTASDKSNKRQRK